MSSDDLTPARTPSSIQRVSRWGIVHAWLAQAAARMLVMSSGPRGLRVTVVDPNHGEAIEDVATTEDPSIAALRALERLHGGGR